MTDNCHLQLEFPTYILQVLNTTDIAAYQRKLQLVIGNCHKLLSIVTCKQELALITSNYHL